jgi:membrane-associated protein
MDFNQLLDLFLHLDKYLDHYAELLGAWLYLILFLIIFCETGLVITPILPGDSLLFLVGALAATNGSPLRLELLIGLLISAAVLGDAVNYFIGFRVGPHVFISERSWLFNKKHLTRTQLFYEKYGGKTIILARFIPIIRTFAPFVAGIGRMEYGRFFRFNIVGGAAWVLIFLLSGYCFGKEVKDYFSIIIVAIVILSILPAVIEYILTRRAERQKAKPIPLQSNETAPVGN